MTVLFYYLIECNWTKGTSTATCTRKNCTRPQSSSNRAWQGATEKGVEDYKWWHFVLNKLRLKSATYTPKHLWPFHIGDTRGERRGCYTYARIIKYMTMSRKFSRAAPAHSDKKWWGVQYLRIITIDMKHRTTNHFTNITAVHWWPAKQWYS